MYFSTRPSPALKPQRWSLTPVRKDLTFWSIPYMKGCPHAGKSNMTIYEESYGQETGTSPFSSSVNVSKVTTASSIQRPLDHPAKGDQA